MAELTGMIASDYGAKKKPITARNPKTNSIIKRTYQTVGNMIRSFEVSDTSINEKDPWTDILSAVRFTTRATIYTTIQAASMQLVFVRDAY
eukprot:7736920-Ditylum_brightwellii.AAC.1